MSCTNCSHRLSGKCIHPVCFEPIKEVKGGLLRVFEVRRRPLAMTFFDQHCKWFKYVLTLEL